MKCNQNIKIICDRVILVPYETQHVLKYHDWMKSEELQELTASEALTLEQEYEMQLSWRNDDNKCTFIILDRHSVESVGNTEIESMVGDVNLFFNDEDDPKSAETEIMIAETGARGKGLGKESLYCMMRYGIEELGVTSYTAKIGYTNEASLKMFNKLGFVEISRSEVFQEVTLRQEVSESVRKTFESETKSYQIVPYSGS